MGDQFDALMPTSAQAPAPSPAPEPAPAPAPAASDMNANVCGGIGCSLGDGMPGHMTGKPGQMTIDAIKASELASAYETSHELDHSKLKGWSREEIRGAKYVLEEMGFTICDVKGDGACFYRCLAVALDNDEQEHKTYRQSVSEHLTFVMKAVSGPKPEPEIQELYELMATSLPVGDDQSTHGVIEQFVMYLSLHDEQVDNLGILLSAKILEVDIHVHQVDGSIFDFRTPTPCSPIILRYMSSMMAATTSICDDST